MWAGLFYGDNASLSHRGLPPLGRGSILICPCLVGLHPGLFGRCFIGSTHGLQSDDDFVDLPGEFIIALLAVRGHRREEVLSHIRGFHAEHVWNGAHDPAACGPLAIDEDRYRTAGAGFATVVLKVVDEGDRMSDGMMPSAFWRSRTSRRYWSQPILGVGARGWQYDGVRGSMRVAS